MKNVIIFIAIIASILGGRYLVDAVITKQTVDNLSNPSSTPVITESEARAEFMSGCNTNEFEMQSDYCVCVYDQIREKSTVNQIVNDGLTLTETEMQTKYENEIDYCINQTYPTVNQ